jgi:dGTPase
MVQDVIINTKKNIINYNIKNINDIHKCLHPIVCFSKKMSLFDVRIKKFLKQKMYFHKSVIYKTNFGKKIINSLFLKITKNPDKYIDTKKIKKANLNRAIGDFIAGMTDRFAINLYNKSK